jgi:CTP:molybdopterin cytidylyltransferase MocA
MAARLAEALSPGALAAAPAHGGRRGHPVLLTRPLFDELISFSGGSGAQSMLGTLGARLVLVESESDGVLFDVDRRVDLDGLEP